MSKCKINFLTLRLQTWRITLYLTPLTTQGPGILPNAFQPASHTYSPPHFGNPYHLPAYTCKIQFCRDRKSLSRKGMETIAGHGRRILEPDV